MALDKYNFADYSSDDEDQLNKKNLIRGEKSDEENELSDENIVSENEIEVESLIDNEEESIDTLPLDLNVKKAMQRERYTETDVQHRITRLQLTTFECTEMMKTLMEQITKGMQVPNNEKYEALSDEQIAALHIVHAGWIYDLNTKTQWVPSHNNIVRRTDRFKRKEETYTLHDLQLDQVFYLLSNIIGHDVFIQEIKLMQNIGIERMNCIDCVDHL